VATVARSEGLGPSAFRRPMPSVRPVRHSRNGRSRSAGCPGSPHESGVVRSVCEKAVRDRPPRHVGRGPLLPAMGLDRLTIQDYVWCGRRTSRGLAWAARVPTSSRELPRWARAWPPAGVCLVGLVVTPARCSQADAARAALPPYAARAAQPLSLPILLGRLFQDLASVRLAGWS
jgi:hypothetical protein